MKRRSSYTSGSNCHCLFTLAALHAHCIFFTLEANLSFSTLLHSFSGTIILFTLPTFSVTAFFFLFLNYQACMLTFNINFISIITVLSSTAVSQSYILQPRLPHQPSFLRSCTCKHSQCIMLACHLTVFYSPEFLLSFYTRQPSFKPACTRSISNVSHSPAFFLTGLHSQRSQCLTLASLLSHGLAPAAF